MNEPDESLELGKVEITRRISADGSDVEINVFYSDGLPVIDALGMIAFAQAVCLNDYQHHEDYGPSR